MVNSMTGFARAQIMDDLGCLTWEIRSVNHRYFDVSWHLPDAFGTHEADLRARLQEKCRRGRVDCRLTYHPSDTIPHEVQLNPSLVTALQQASDKLQHAFPQARPLGVSDVLKWPGMLALQLTKNTDLDALILTSFEACLDKMIQSRQQEGDKLRRLIEQRLAQAELLIPEIQQLAAQGIDAQRARLLQRIREADVTIEPDRLEAEMVCFAQKADITEEVDRLRTHFTAIRSVLASDEAMGRRLDFMVQECHRETNTLGVKVTGRESTQRVVSLKVFIEQIREQVQNIE